MNFKELKEFFSDRRIMLVAVLSLLAFGLIFLRDLNPSTVDLHFGIEFVGGVRIPISLEQSVDSATMASMVDTIKLRINKFGLSQAVVRPLGDKEIIVEIPRADSSVIKSVENILREQGHFEALVDGKLALDGTNILGNAVGGSGNENVNTQGEDVSWQLVFAITGDGEEHFAEAAAGKIGYPVYMFLDRPKNALVLLSQSDLPGGIASSETALSEALLKEGDDIALFYVEDFENRESEFSALAANKTLVIASENLSFSKPEVVAALEKLGFEELKLGEEVTNATKRIAFKTQEEMIPEIISFQSAGLTETVLSRWGAIGLRSAPTLQVEPLKQNAISQYSITGSARGETLKEKKANAVNELKELKSVLSGGKLPVATSIGSYYDIAPSLGREFLNYSAIGIFLAIAAVSIVIVFRYRKLKLVIPIVVVNAIEVLLLVAIIGGFGTIDLAVMAGIITLIGTGVDDQIIITEELLKKRKREEGAETEPERGNKERIARAFYIIFITAGVSIASMLPLLLSGIVEVMGFALAAILGVIIGVLFTRPAFGVIASELFKHEHERA
ncbi:hypothetical protein H0N96_02770 [Candidatus Micrarchaeota archaeon]|nr:hypothetical protein [Candidatus Micrarchaeota archaeon]